MHQFVPAVVAIILLALVIWVLILIFMGYSIWDNAKGRKLEKAGMKD